MELGWARPTRIGREGAEPARLALWPDDELVVAHPQRTEAAEVAPRPDVLPRTAVACGGVAAVSGCNPETLSHEEKAGARKDEHNVKHHQVYKES